MNKEEGRFSKHWDFILIDIVCIELSYLLAFYIRRWEGSFDEVAYSTLNLIMFLSYVILFAVGDNYKGIMRRRYPREMRKTVVYNIEMLAIAFFVVFFLRSSLLYSRKFFIYFFIINCILTFFGRVLRRKWLYAKNKNARHQEHMMVVADANHIDDIIKTFNKMPFKEFRVTAAVVVDRPFKPGKKVQGVPVMASPENMHEYALNHVIDRVFLACDIDNEQVDRFLNMGINVNLSIAGQFAGVKNPTIENIDKFTVVTAGINSMTLEQRFVKRLSDIVFSIIGLACTLIFTIIIGPIIYIQSPGPIFFVQTRVGKNGRKFKFYKFRSMYMDAEERKKELMEQNKMQGLMFKIDDDPRIIPIGKFIRRTSIDEFPQFFNVLKGEMSLVGTRPPTVDEYEHYEERHKSRLAMKPGLTGMWQVSGRSDIVDFEEVVRLDNEYIRNFSIGLDVKIIKDTFLAILSRKGSV